jgi:hypothetical protein
MFVWVFAVAGSKLDGIGFAKEQIGHIHVAFAPKAGAAGAIERDGLSWRAGVAAGVYGELRTDSDVCLFALEYKVIFGDDLRKPAC